MMASELKRTISVRDPSEEVEDGQAPHWHAAGDDLTKSHPALCGAEPTDHWPEKGFVITCPLCLMMLTNPK